MQATIERDFGVELIHRTAGLSVYCAQRDDVWHFVFSSEDSNTPKRPSDFHLAPIFQRHLPRYGVALAAEKLWKMGSETHASGSGMANALAARMGLSSRGSGQLSISSTPRTSDLPLSVVALIQADVNALSASRDGVARTGSDFILRGSRTAKGNPVDYSSREIVDGIAFERDALGRLDAKRFALFSAYCTWRDFIKDNADIRQHIARGIADELANWDATKFGDDEYWKSVCAIQDATFPHRIWGPDVDESQERIASAVGDVLEKLSSTQFAQFVLMNGMHRGGLFHPLATILGLQDFDSYNYWRTVDFQPDSSEEQEIRTQTAFIDLFGSLTTHLH